MPDAYRVVWLAGDIVLENAPSRTPTQNETIADEVGAIFLKLDHKQHEDNVLSQAVPGSSRIGLAALLKGVEEAQQEILDYESLSTDRPVNPMSVRDEKMEALASLRIAVQAAFYEQTGVNG